MASSSTISSKGQITVPHEVRTRLGLSAGDRVEFVVEGGRTILKPLRSETDPFAEFKGILDPFPGGEKGIHEWIGDMRGDEPDRA